METRSRGGGKWKRSPKLCILTPTKFVQLDGQTDTPKSSSPSPSIAPLPTFSWESEAGMETKSESKPDLEPEPALNTVPDPEPETVPEAEPEPESEPGPDFGCQTESRPNPDSEPGPRTKTESDPEPVLKEPEPRLKSKCDYSNCTSIFVSGSYRVICGELDFCCLFHHDYDHYIRSNETYVQYSCKLGVEVPST